MVSPRNFKENSLIASGFKLLVEMTTIPSLYHMVTSGIHQRCWRQTRFNVVNRRRLPGEGWGRIGRPAQNASETARVSIELGSGGILEQSLRSDEGFCNREIGR